MKNGIDTGDRSGTGGFFAENNHKAEAKDRANSPEAIPLQSYIDGKITLDELTKILALLHKDDGKSDTEPDEGKFWNDPNELLIAGSYAYSDADSAARLFSKLAESGEYFSRGGQVVKPNQQDGLVPVTEQSLRTEVHSLFERVLEVNIENGGKGTLTKNKTNLSRDAASAFLAASDKAPLKEIAIVTACPVLCDDKKGGVKICRSGFSDAPNGGVYVTAGDSIEPDSLDDALHILWQAYNDFDFVSKYDKARAIAMMLTPAMIHASLIGGHIPIDFAEADRSQSGKGYRHDMVAAMYNETVKIVTNRNKGVGSIDEKFCAALASGKTFIRLDNLRGELDSQDVESYLTTHPDTSFHARYLRHEAHIRGGRCIIQASSNGIQGTEDIMNRSCVIRIRKRPTGTKWQKINGLFILDHIKANQGSYLGAIHKVITEWVWRGRPETTEGRHSFHQWAAKLDWIVGNLFGLPSFMEGHQEIQSAASSEVICLLRAFATGLDRLDKLDEALTTSELIELAEEEFGIEMDGKDEKAKVTALGIKLAKQFSHLPKGELNLGGYSVVRKSTRKTFSYNGRVAATKEIKTLTFSRVQPEDPNAGYNSETEEFEGGAEYQF
jgi:hypothetical protein